MPACPTCKRDAPEDARFCPACGADLAGASATPTLDGWDGAAKATSPASAPASGAARHAERFAPGQTLAGRYRIAGLLGRGGMGEVYRADDLRLGQPVALKFLPEALAQDAAALERFRSEVRTARDVSHPNVCRVYDIGEVDGHPFLSMEYIDGEDLSSLLRRIGRLPEDKGVEIARQLCAGLAAAHDRGVLHRDLKPANIMLDGRGRVRITDFGLAAAAEEVRGCEAAAGTPAYMAPEQLTGGVVTARTDIYALGLVLYEIFTGRRVYEGVSRSRSAVAEPSAAPASLSSVVGPIHPDVERVVQRCLEADPAQRPASALAVSAALPGGDPLAAALAAGETPSPEMVAAAGADGALTVRAAVALLAATLAGLACVLLMADRALLLSRTSLGKPPVLLSYQAREIAASLGHETAPVDAASGFYYHGSYLAHLERTDETSTRWDALAQERPSAVGFWRREEPRPLVPLAHPDTFFSAVRPLTTNPPRLEPGTLTMGLDPQGRLLWLHAVPDRFAPEGEPVPATEWGLLFEAADLDASRFEPVEPRLSPAHFADTRAAWVGSFEESPDLPVRLEAGAYRGTIVEFTVLYPWDVESMERAGGAGADRAPAGIGAVVSAVAASVFQFGVIGGAALLAWRSYRTGRGDRRGAVRLGALAAGLSLARWALGSHHVADAGGEATIFFFGLVGAVVMGILVWATYLALEPYVRRIWPQSLIAWSRLLAGQWRSPLVGRHVLIGCVAGTVGATLMLLARIAPPWVGLPPPPLLRTRVDSLAGPAAALSLMAAEFLDSLAVPMAFLLLAAVLRLVVRHRMASALVFWVILTATSPFIGGTGWLGWVVGGTAAALLSWLLFGPGLLAAVAAFFFAGLLTWTFPITTDLGGWTTHAALLPVVFVVAVALAAFYLSIGGRRILPPSVLDSPAAVG